MPPSAGCRGPTASACQNPRAPPPASAVCILLAIIEGRDASVRVVDNMMVVVDLVMVLHATAFQWQQLE